MRSPLFLPCYVRNRTDVETRPADRIRQYEDQKRRWIDQHPEATPAEYQAAMTAIACRLGV